MLIFSWLQKNLGLGHVCGAWKKQSAILVPVRKKTVMLIFIYIQKEYAP